LAEARLEWHLGPPRSTADSKNSRASCRSKHSLSHPCGLGGKLSMSLIMRTAAAEGEQQHGASNFANTHGHTHAKLKMHT
jgi:hypothetical protein